MDADTRKISRLRRISISGFRRGAQNNTRGRVCSPVRANCISSRRSGFTLIEVLLALALLGMLTTGIFAVQRGAMQVSNEVTTRQLQTLRMHSFCELLRRNYEQLPGNARVILTPTGGANSGLSEVAFVDYPLAFSWPGVPAGSKTVIFRAERSITGFGTQAALLYLDEEQSTDYEQGRLNENTAMARLTLIDGLRTLTWRFFDDSKQEWVYEWERTNTRRPSFVELGLEFLDGQDPVRLVFWIPTVANPQTFTQAAGGGGAGGGGAGGGGEGGPPGGGPPPGAGPGGPGGGGPPGGGGGGGRRGGGGGGGGGGQRGGGGGGGGGR